VVFLSEAKDLTADDDNGVGDIFVHNTWTGETERITRDSVLAAAHPATSASGRFVDYLEESGVQDQRVCRVHLYDRKNGRCARHACPEALAEASETARPRFNPDAGQV
jgi:hypothetical protein